MFMISKKSDLEDMKDLPIWIAHLIVSFPNKNIKPIKKKVQLRAVSAFSAKRIIDDIVTNEQTRKIFYVIKKIICPDLIKFYEERGLEYHANY